MSVLAGCVNIKSSEVQHLVARCLGERGASIPRLHLPGRDRSEAAETPVKCSAWL